MKPWRQTFGVVSAMGWGLMVDHTLPITGLTFVWNLICVLLACLLLRFWTFTEK